MCPTGLARRAGSNLTQSAQLSCPSPVSWYLPLPPPHSCFHGSCPEFPSAGSRPNSPVTILHSAPSPSLLLACLSATPAPALLDRLSRIDETGWRELVRSAAGHGVSPLLYDRLASLADPSAPPSALRVPHSLVPATILQSLHEAFFLHAARNALLYRDLAQVVTSLQQQGLRVAVLKGAHLAALVYSHVGLRPMADMDLLVSKEELAKADAVLSGMGYTTDRSQTIEARCQVSQHLAPFSKPPHPRIELHWTIASPILPFRIDMAGIEARLRPVTIAGIKTHVLAPEDLLIHLCTHAAGHSPVPFCHGFRTFCDLAVVLRHYQAELDWSVVRKRAVEWRADLGVYVALRLARDLVQAEVPMVALEALRPADFREADYAQAQEHALSVDKEVHAEENHLDLPRFRTLVTGTTEASFVGKLKFLARTAFPSHDHMAVYMEQFHHLPLTGHRRYTCYLTRALDLTGRGLSLLRYSAVHRQETSTRIRHVQQQTRLWRWLIGSEPKP